MNYGYCCTETCLRSASVFARPKRHRQFEYLGFPAPNRHPHTILQVSRVEIFLGVDAFSPFTPSPIRRHLLEWAHTRRLAPLLAADHSCLDFVPTHCPHVIIGDLPGSL